MSDFADGHVLPDILEPGLRVVFCGTAAGRTSAFRSAYYAGPGNKFWKTLYAVGLTPRLLLPEEFASLPQYGIGLTDLAKYTFGSDSSLRPGDFDVSGFEQKMREFAPQVVCFNGKKAAQHFLGVRRVGYGELSRSIGESRLFVAPSTSAAANGHWDVSYWKELAEQTKSL